MAGREHPGGLERPRLPGSGLSRREVLTALGVTGAGLVAAACGPATPAAPAPTASGAAAPATAASKPAPAASATASGAPTAAAAKPSITGTITYLDQDDDPASVAWHDQFHKDFIAAYPGVQIEDTHYGSADYQEKLTTSLATGAKLDMLFWDTTNIPLLFSEGRLLPLNDLLETIYTDIGGKDKFSAEAQALFTGPNGEIQGIPYYNEPLAWWFRQDLLQEAGLTPPTGHWDWTFLLKAVKATHKPPNVYGVGFPTARKAGTLQPIMSFILNKAATWCRPISRMWPSTHRKCARLTS